MKIVMVTPFPLQQENIAGGVAAVSCYLSQALVALGHDVVIVAPGKKFGDKEQRSSTTIHWLGSPRKPGFLSYSFSQRKQIHCLLNELSGDIVHFQGAFGWSIGYSQPCVVTIHGIAEKDAAYSGGWLKSRIAAWIIGWREKLGRRHAKHVISISPYATELLASQLTGQVHELNNPIDDSLFEYVPRVEGRQDLLISAGVVGERKNTLGIINCFAEIRKHHPELRLFICGATPEQSYLARCQQRITELQLEDCVEFKGNLDRGQLYEYLSAAKAHIMLSRQETAPMSIAESMALGTPSIAPAAFGIPYMIEDQQNGWLLTGHEDSKALQRIAEQLQGQSWNDVSSRAIKESQRYRPETVAKETLKIYQQAMSQ